MQDYPLNHLDLYKFNTRDIVQVETNVPANLAHLAGKRGVILYHAGYKSGAPCAEAIMIGARVLDVQRFRKIGQIGETSGGQIHVVPIEHLAKVTNPGAELDGDSVLA